MKSKNVRKLLVVIVAIAVLVISGVGAERYITSKPYHLPSVKTRPVETEAPVEEAAAEVTEEAPVEEIPAEEEIIEEAPVEEVPAEEIIPEAPVEEVPAEEIIPEAPVEEAPVEEIVPEAPVEEVPVEEIVPEAPVEEAPVEEIIPEAPVEEAPVEEIIPEAPVEEAPVEEIIPEAPVEEAPVEEIPAEPVVEEAPAEEPIAEEIPAEPVVEEAPAEEPIAEEIPAEPVVEEAPAEEPIAEEIPAEPVVEEAPVEDPQPVELPAVIATRTLMLPADVLDENGNVIASLTAGEAVSVVEYLDGQLKVLVNDQVGFISADVVMPEFTTVPGNLTGEMTAEEGTVLYAVPSLQGAVMSSIPEYTLVYVRGLAAEWAKVEVIMDDGASYTGYVQKAFLKLMPTPEPLAVPEVWVEAASEEAQNDGKVYEGETLYLCANVLNYQDLVVLQWQCDYGTGEWQDIPGANSARYPIVVTAENVNYLFRLMLTIPEQ